MRILMASDGSKDAISAARFGSVIARAAGADVHLLGIADSRQQADQLQASLAELGDELAGTGQCRVEISTRIGHPDEQIMAETNDHFYHLVVIGPRGSRQRGMFALGSTARRLARYLKVPLLVGIRPGGEIKRVLLCTSGEKPAEVDAHVCGALAALVGAEVTILHVMSQIALDDTSLMADLAQDAHGLMARGAREGEHLKKIISIMAGQGLMSSHCEPKVRHGLVMDEILSELRENAYDMIVIGAHQVPEGLAFRELREMLQENIADRILTHARCPVLVVRALDPATWVVSAGDAQATTAQGIRMSD